MDAIGKRIATNTDQQTENDLRVVVAPFLREPRLAEVVLPVCLKIKGCDIIEQYTDSPSQNPLGVTHAYILDYLVLTVAQLVKVAVYPGQVQVLVEVVLQVLHRRSLACRVGKARLHQLSEDGILNLVEPHNVENMVKKQVGTVQEHITDV